MKITQFFIDHHKFANLVLLFAILLGLLTLKTLPRQDMPDINFDILTIRTNYSGASPEDVEINVTDPIEDELEEVDGIERIESFSIENMSYIIVTVDPDLNSNEKERIKRDVRNAVDRVTGLPEEVLDRPYVDEQRSSSYPVIEVAVYGDHVSEQFLRKVAKDLESDLRSIDGVGSIDKVGYRKREIQIQADIEKMNEHYVSFTEILSAIKSRNVKVSGGTIESTVNEKKVVTFAEFDEPMDVGQCIVRSNFSGKQLRVSDVAIVKDDYERHRIRVRTNGRNSINVIVKRKAQSDVIDLSEELHTVISRYQENFKDQGVGIHVVVDYTRYTSSLLDIVTNNAVIGLLLVLCVLFFFLNGHTAFWVALGLPLSIFGAFLFFPLFDMTVNQIVLIAMIIVLGMLVDDAIVVAENINRHQQDGMSFREAAIKGAEEVFWPITVTIMTTIICFAPMYFMRGIMGKFVFSIPTVVILMLILSLFESVTILPAHLAHVNRKHINKPKMWMVKLREFYGRHLKLCLHHRKWVIGGSLALLVVTIVFSAMTNRFVLFPTQDADVFYIVMETTPGDSLEETLEKVLKVEESVSQISPDLMMGYTTQLGHHRTDEAANTPAEHEHWALMTVYLHPAKDREVRSETIISDLKKQTEFIEGFQMLNVRELQDGPPVGSPITLTLISDDFDLCVQYERKIWALLNTMNGVHSLETTNRLGKQEVRLKLDYDLMSKIGITAQDVAQTIRMAYDGMISTTMRRDGEELDFRIRLKDSQRGREETLKQLLMRNNEGKLIRVGDIARFEEGQGLESITHYDGRKSLTITGKIDDELITSRIVNEAVRKKFGPSIKETPGLKIEFGGEEKETATSMQNFFVAFLCGLLGIYCILMLLLNSYLQPLLIMAAIPFGVTGVLIAFYLHGVPMSFLGLVGTLGMIGVVVNDSLVMVTYLNKLRDDHGEMTLDLILEGAKTRFRPVILTTITTVIGLMPTVYGIGGYEPFLVPMVLAMSWGLAFATFITLVIVPVLYSYLGETS